jgi:hypothetical protein
MKKHEQEALLGYLEFTLTTMVEQNEITLRKKFSFDQETIDALVGMMYDNAYEVLNEIERSYDDVNKLIVSNPNSKAN